MSVGSPTGSPVSRMAGGSSSLPYMADALKYAVDFSTAHSITKGGGALTTTRTGSQVIEDFEGLLKMIPEDHAARKGVRVVENYHSNPTVYGSSAGALVEGNKITISAQYQGVFPGNSIYKYATVEAGKVYQFSIDIMIESGETACNKYLVQETGTATFTYSPSNFMQGTFTLGEWTRRSVLFTCTTSGTLILKIRFDGTSNFPVFYLDEPMFEDVTGQTNQNPSSYVEDLEYFDYENGNTVDSNGVVTESAGAAIPQATMKGYLKEIGATNKCTNYNANPDASLTGLVKSGDAAATLSRVDDSTELANAGLDCICYSGYAVKFDNSAGTGNAYCDISGIVGNLNAHSISAYARVTGSNTGDLMFSIDLGAGVTNFSNSTYQKITLENISTLTSINNEMRVRARPGAVVYFVLNQLEENIRTTSPIVTLGTATIRGATSTKDSGPRLPDNNTYGIDHIYVTIASADVTTGDRIWVDYSNNANQVYLVLNSNSRPLLTKKINNSYIQCNAPVLTYSPGDLLSIGWAYDDTDGMKIMVAVNGVLVPTIGTNSNTDDRVLDPYERYNGTRPSDTGCHYHRKHSTYYGKISGAALQAKVEQEAALLLAS